MDRARLDADVSIDARKSRWAKGKQMAKKKKKELDSAAVFKKRSADMYGNHKKRAARDGIYLDYELDGLRELIHRSAEEPCPFCSCEITAHNFSADHKVPISRRGGHSITNLVICCLDCNLAKGPIEYYEWREVMKVVSTWPMPIRKHFIARLKAGARRAKGFHMFGELKFAGPPESSNPT